MPLLFELGPFGVLLIGAALVGLVVYLQYRHTQQRREELVLAATRLGLQFDVRDPFGLTGLPFAFLRRGDRQRTKDVLHGVLDGDHVQVFDLDLEYVSTDSNGHRHTRTEHYTCATLELPGAWFPHIELERESLLSRAKGALGFRDVQFESDAFNRAWHVRCEDKRFAYALVDPGVMEFLLDLQGFRFELNGDAMFAVHDRLDPEDFLSLHRALLAFRARLPAVATELYPGADDARRHLS
jgi:hypothetical protein